jgi:hypothetical protein
MDLSASTVRKKRRGKCRGGEGREERSREEEGRGV